MSPRTVVQLRGGIGNQLFQYAAGCVVARNTGAPLLLDASFIRWEGYRDYALARIGVTEEAHDYDIPVRELSEDDNATAEYARDRFNAEVVREIGHNYHDQLAAAPAGSYLVGSWQSERHFAELTDELRERFGPDRFTGLSLSARAFADEIDAAGRSSVAVHVRRGDYVAVEWAAKLLPPKDVDYYYAAAEMIANAVPRPHYFVFTDDPRWCEQELVLPGPARIVSGDSSDVEDLALIGRCHHAAISNSTFGWWGAWLGERPDSIIVAPKRWFGEPAIPEQDKLPQRWLRV
ncbi:MAG: alpha-1,2-fucosyltransferase [Thermoleophilaceae bacterium]|nr:alpha-1,2-fucosyltransferase [Thermoleophilaceae bacterium]